jgi:hypothetical protein
VSRSFRLSTQIAIVIVSVGAIELILVVGVVVGYLYFLDQTWPESLPASTHGAIILMRSGGLPSTDQVEAACRADQALNASGAPDMSPMIGVLSAIALGFCIVAGSALSLWLARPPLRQLLRLPGKWLMGI